MWPGWIKSLCCPTSSSSPFVVSLPCTHNMHTTQMFALPYSEFELWQKFFKKACLYFQLALASLGLPKFHCSYLSHKFSDGVPIWGVFFFKVRIYLVRYQGQTFYTVQQCGKAGECSLQSFSHLILFITQRQGDNTYGSATRWHIDSFGRSRLPASRHWTRELRL